jgi:actin-related protein 8
MQDYSVILVLPDFYEKTYTREMCHLILVTMGFKQLCVQQVRKSDSRISHAESLQESICATFGSGISNACVIDIGAVKTSIACVDEGMVIPDSRSVNTTYNISYLRHTCSGLRCQSQAMT